MNSLIKQLYDTKVTLSKGRHKNVIYTRETDKSKRNVEILYEGDIESYTFPNVYNTIISTTNNSLKTAQDYAAKFKDVTVVLFVNPKLLVDYKRPVSFKHCICTNIVEILKSSDYFQNNILNYNNGLYTEQNIYIPGVIHLKNDKFEYHPELLQTDYLISYIPENKDFYFTDRYILKLETKINKLLSILAMNNTKTVIFCIDALHKKSRDKRDIIKVINKSIYNFDGVFENILFAI